MNVILDEMRVVQGEVIDACLVPLEIDSPAEIDVSLDCESPAALQVLHRYLNPISRALRPGGKVSGIIHSGGDSYTVVVADDYIEINRETHSSVVNLVKELAAFLRVLDPSLRNQVRAVRRDAQLSKPESNIGRPWQEHARIPPPRSEQDDVFLPGRLNPLPRRSERELADWRPPNRLRLARIAS